MRALGFQPKGSVMLATRMLIMTTISKTVVSDCGPRTPAHEADESRVETWSMRRGLSTHNPSLNLRPVSIGGGQSIPYLRRVLSCPRPTRPPVRLKSVFGYSCCQYGSSKTPHYSYDAI